MYKNSEHLAFVFHPDLITLIVPFSDQTDTQNVSWKSPPCKVHCLTLSNPGVGLGVISNFSSASVSIQLVLILLEW